MQTQPAVPMQMFETGLVQLLFVLLDMFFRAQNQAMRNELEQLVVKGKG